MRTLTDGDEDTSEAARTPCTRGYDVIRSSRYTPETTARALEGRFRVHKSVVRLEGDVDWTINPERSRTFGSNLHRFTWIDPLIFTYRTQDDLDALSQAAALALDWVADHPDAPRLATRSPTWGDKVTADRAPFIAFIARAMECEGIASRGDSKLLERSVAQHARLLTASRNYAATNHGLFMDLGLIFLAESAATPAQAREWRELATERFRSTLLSRVVPSEGLWLEHSTSYHFVVLEKLRQFLEAIPKDDGQLVDLLARMESVGSWLIEPDGRIVQFGESDLDKGDEALTAAGTRLEGMLALPASGLAVVREGDSYLAVTAGYHSQTHKQSDDLSFDLYEAGHRIVSDTGLFHKDRDEVYAFASSNRAHSTLVVDDQGWPRDDASAYGSGIVATGQGDGWYAIQARNPLLAAQGVDHDRFYLYRPGFGLVVVDSLGSDVEHSYSRRFQFGPDIRVRAQPAALRLSAPGFEGALTYDADAGVSVVKGQPEPIQGYTYPAFEEAVPRYTANLTTFGSDRLDTAAIGIGRSLGAEAALSGDTLAISLNEDGVPAQLTVVRSGDSLTVEVS